MDDYLSCQCGNETDFVEITIAKFATDQQGERGEKLSEQISYACNKCQVIVQVEQPEKDDENEEDESNTDDNKANDTD